MFENIKKNLLMPALSRVGTATATWLMATANIDGSTAQAVELAVLAIGLVMADFFTSYMNRKRGS